MYYVRFVKTLIKCDDSAMTFALVSSCMAIGLVLLFFPIGFICHWIFRIFVWFVMGPWMRLAERAAAKRGSPQQMQKIMEEIKVREQKRLIQARIMNEEAMKLKATRIMRFGRFAIRVPFANIIRFRDQPLPESYAEQKSPEYYDNACSSKHSIISSQSVTHYVPGQKHYGVMIPALCASNVKQMQKMRRDKKEQLQNRQSPPITDLFFRNDHKHSSNYSTVLSPDKLFNLRTYPSFSQLLLEIEETNEEGEEGFELVPLYDWSLIPVCGDDGLKYHKSKGIKPREPNTIDEGVSLHEELVSSLETDETKIIKSVLSDLTLN